MLAEGETKAHAPSPSRRFRLPRLTERTRVLAVVALANLPLLLLAAVALWQGVAAAEARVAEERTQAAQAAATLAEALVVDNITALQGLAATPLLTDPANHASLSPVLARITDLNPNLDNLALIDAEGWNITSRITAPRSVNIADRDYFQQALTAGRPAVSGAIIGRASNIPAANLTIPVELDDGRRFVLLGVLSLGRFSEMLQGIAGGREIEVIVLDHEGTVFIHPDFEVAQSLASFRGRPEVEAALAGQVGSQRLIDSDGVDRLVAFARVPTTGWIVLLRQPTSVAFELVQRQLLGAIGLFALAGLVATLVASYLGGRLGRFYQGEVEARARAETAAQELRAISAENEHRRQFLEELIASSPVAIALMRGPEHRFETVNSRYQALKPGVTMIGRTFAEVFADEAAQDLRAILDEVYRTGKQYTRLDLPYVVDDSGSAEPRYFTTVISRHAGPEGQEGGVLVVVLETTEAVLARRRAEREKDEFLSMASHELKTPLASLKLSSQLMGRMAEGGNVNLERLRRSVRTMDSQLDRATELISDLLDVSRIQTGQLHLRREPVDLVRLVRSVTQQQRDMLPEDSSHEILGQVQEESLVVQADEARLEQVLTNLLSNAVKYSPRGGRVEVRLARQDGYAALSVSDQGIGIAEDERDKIFQPFSRTSEARLSGVEGTGLGLYISRRIVEAHGGRIDVRPNPDGGTTFEVVLPLAEPAMAQSG